MLYIFAAMTGFRRSELGRLTLRSFDLTAIPPTVRIEAACSKHRRLDVQVLHPELVERLVKWVITQRFSIANGGGMDVFLSLQQNAMQAAVPLFPIVAKNGGVERQTSDMMVHDLGAARRAWIHEVDCVEERHRREESDFLRYRNSDGKYADFHGLRHTFISNLGRAGVSPKTAQVLARHSDISLTMNIYSHVDQAAQADAINLLPGIPGKKAS
jgi:Site-specific recombinase XerD